MLSVFVVLATVTGHIACAEPAGVPAAQTRAAAMELGQWAIANSNRAVLANAVELALRSGASLDSDDPWSIADLADRLAAMPGGQADLDRIRATRARGVIAGVSRLDVTLGPGDTHRVPLTMAGDEPAIVEARLKIGSNGADLDLQIVGPNDLMLEDAGPETGTATIGAYLEFRPETCLDIEVILRNVGSGTANAVMLAPASSLIACGN
ncbi:MAG: hypothetical protein AAGA05_10370 [Pseudomonadota bacterium]